MECKRNPKKFWQYVNRHTKSKTDIGDLKWHDKNGDEKIAESDDVKATILQNFFSSVYTVESDNDFDTLPSRMDVHVDRTTFTVTEDDIYKKLIQLKIDKSPGPDLIHPRVLYETRNVIARPLFLIFRKSLEFGTLPTDWKLAEVTAVHKKGSKSDSGNYRPISLTSVCCKLLESLVRDHIMKHLLDNNLLSNKQYGFIKGRSTMLQLLHMMDDWTLCLEKGGQIDAIYSDFEKAFDKVPHKRLISKLHSYNIDEGIIKWIVDFLKARKYRVRVNGSYSGWHDVTSGIPQASVLGPILCLIYINDLEDSCGP